MTDQNELQVKLEALTNIYAEKLPEKLEQLKQAWEHLPKNSWDDDGFEIVHRMVHSLTGSGKTLGFGAISNVAHKLEEYLNQLAQTKTVLSEDQCNNVQVLLSELKQVATFRNDSHPVELVNFAQPDRHVADCQRIFLVDDDPELAELLKLQLNYFGYFVRIFNTLADFRLAMQENPYGVVLMDVSFPEDSLGGIRVMKEIQQQRATPLPVIFMSACEEFSEKLEAVRAGAIAYLTKPIDIGSLIDRLDTLTSTLPTERYRVLIIDDSEAVSTYYSTLLEYAGMTVRMVNNPLDVMDPLLEFAPDLILLDIYMPQCNGMELAKTIRLMDAFVGIPIVFLSAEGNLDKQLFAMGFGGDDFLTKPIQPQHLVSSVLNRVRRSLTLRSFMVRDSLTGLLNHASIKDQLDREVARAIRQGTQLSFAMIDIDHFKKVNDTYGHPAGDRVIKNLSRMLKQRLRTTDMIGRYGGEEFAVVMYDTDAETAVRVIDAIRKDFSQLQHLNKFSVSFSCGIADVSCFGDPTQLCNAADRALYQAKHAGRDQVFYKGS